MKAFVLGSGGFIGKRVVGELISLGCFVHALDIVDTPLRLDAKNFVTHRLDITDFESLNALVAQHKPNIVINMSYLRETAPRPALKVNVLGMDNCFEAARLNDVEHVVFASSIAVNGRQSQYGARDICESDPTFPTYQYAVHKVFNEWQAHEYRTKHGMTITGIRIAHAAAPDKTVGAVDHVQCIVKPALGSPIRFPFQDTKRCLIHVDDVASITARIGCNLKPKHELYNTGGQTMSLGDLATVVKKHIPDAQISFEAELGGDEKSVAYRFDNSRLLDEFSIELPDYEQRVIQMIKESRS